MKNYGLIIEQPKETDYFLGQEKIDNKIICQDGQWDKYLPKKEYQNLGFETMACVSFSALNCLETYFKATYNYELNFSDRFTAKMSGTTHNGNSLNNVANSIRHDGLVYEKDYPMVSSWNEYYQTIPFKLKMAGKNFLDSYEVEYEWLFAGTYLPSVYQKQKQLMEALKYSPVQVIVYAWNKKGEYYINNGTQYNHAVMCYGYVKGEYWKIYDHYNNTYKKLAWDYNFSSAKKYTIKKIGRVYTTHNDGEVDGHLFKKGAVLSFWEFWRAIFKRLSSKK